MSTVSDLSQLMTIMRYEMLKFLRGKKLYIMFGLIAVIAVAIMIIPPALGEAYPNADEFIQFFTQFANILVILIVTLFGADSIVYDFEKGTAFVLYPNPVRRRTIFVGKFLSAFLVSAGVLAVYYMLAAVLDFGINQAVPLETVWSLLLAIGYMFALMSVTFLISTMMKSTLAASVIVFALFFLVFSMVEGVLTVVGQEPFFVITSMSTVIQDIMVTPFPETVRQDFGAFQVLIYHPTVRTALLVFAGYAIPSLALAYNRFLKKELQ